MSQNENSGNETIRENRTGVLVEPELAQELVEGVQGFSPEPQLDPLSGAEIRAPYTEEGWTVGSLPAGQDGSTVLLLDKLGARLAFERSGVRLYEGLMRKLDTAANAPSEPTLEDLQHIRDEELGHMHMLEQHITMLGGDPTAVTPAADIAATMTAGVLKVVADPRTTVTQCLEAVLTAELLDNDCWAVLVQMLQARDMNDEAEDFIEALTDEQEHLDKVRGWILAEARSMVAETDADNEAVDEESDDSEESDDDESQ